MSLAELSKTSMQSVLAVIVVVGGFYILTFEHPTTDVKIAVVGMMGTVLGFYFGSSRGSQLKDNK